MLCYILAQYAPQVHENILLFFRHKKQSHRNCCRILNINLVIGICKFISSKLWMLPTPTRHLQIQFQQVADASDPDQASTNPIPASCRCFRPQDMYLQIHIQQIADASDPDQASANPIPANCRCFQPQPGICKSNSSKLQMLPRPEFTPICICKSNSNKLQMLPTPGYVSANSYPTNCRCFRPWPGICSSQNNKSKMPTGEFSSQIRWWASLLHLYFIK